jgi:nucleotide-binding universal stress UspA family protein
MIAVVTSLMAPPMLRWTLSRIQIGSEEQARLEREERRQDSFVGNLKRVLVPVRGSGPTDTAAKVVGLLVNDEDVEVTKLYLRPEKGRDDRPGDSDALDEHVDRTRTRVRTLDASPARTILDEAGRGYDLLVLSATERRTRGGTSLFEPFVDDVIQDSPCPLLVVSSFRDEQHCTRLAHLPGGHILVPTSGADVDRYSTEVAFSMASGTDTIVDLVHVVSGPQHAVRLRGDEAIMHAVDIGEDLVAKTAEAGQALGANVQTDVLVADHPESAIVERAQQRADLIVLASSRRPVTQRAFFGHRIDYVVGHAPCPVVIIGAR